MSAITADKEETYEENTATAIKTGSTDVLGKDSKYPMDDSQGEIRPDSSPEWKLSFSDSWPEGKLRFTKGASGRHSKVQVGGELRNAIDGEDQQDQACQDEWAGPCEVQEQQVREEGGTVAPGVEDGGEREEIAGDLGRTDITAEGGEARRLAVAMGNNVEGLRSCAGGEAAGEDEQEGWEVDMGGEEGGMGSKKEAQESEVARDKIVIFADDTMCSSVRASVYEVKQAMENMFNRLKEYTDANQLMLNSDKTHFILIMTPQKRQFYPDEETVKFGDDTVTESKYERCLGMQVSNILCSWKFHISKGEKSILSKCGRVLNDLKKTSGYFSYKRRLTIGKSLVMSIIMYGAELYGPAATIQELELLQALQNRLVRWIRQSKTGNSHQERRLCGIMSVFQMIVFRVLCLGLTVLRTEKPANLYSSIRGRGEEENHLRRSNRFNLVQPSQQYYGKQSWRSFFVHYYNQLPANLRGLRPWKQGEKRQLKQWVGASVPEMRSEDLM